MTAITEREKQTKEITNQLIDPGPGSLEERLEEIKAFAISRLTDLRRLLAKPSSVHEACALLPEQLGRFTLSGF